MSSKIGPQHTHDFLILKGIQATKQEVTNELNSEKEEQSVDETMLNKMLQLFEENTQLRNELLASRNELLASRNELLASKDEQIKSMKTIGELCCEKVQLKEQLVMAKETIKEQASRISLFEEERSQHQQEMNNIRFSTQQQLLDNVIKQNDINDMEKQLLQAKEKHAKAEEEFKQKQLELDNHMKEVEQQKEELDKRKKELNKRERRLNEEQMAKNAEHIAEKVKLNLCINEYSTKQKEYDAVIIVLSHALSSYGTFAKYTIEELDRNATGLNHCKWTTMHKHHDVNYTSIRKYLHNNLTNNVSKEKMLIDTIVVYRNN